MATMKKFLLCGAALVALVAAAPASAADIPVRGPLYKAAPPPPPVFNWTGFYIGAHVGYGWTYHWPGLPAEPDGIFGGLQVGYNWQISRNWVVGIEADIAATDISANVGGFDSSLDYIGTVRGRVGYAWDRTLLYVTGGYAYGDNNINGSSNTHDGWVIGAGVEWAFAPNWSAKLEYLHIELDSKFYPSIGSAQDLETNLVKLGVNYRFGW
jgi:outer membrane immunogenic protein